jgi:hypothetical protein
VNRELRGLIRTEALNRVNKKRCKLIADYTHGNISGHQCRIFLNDYVRDSIPFKDEMEAIQSHGRAVQKATLDRTVRPEDEEIELTMIDILNDVIRGNQSLMRAESKMERLLLLVPEPKKGEWVEIFSSLCKTRGLVT